MANIALPGGDGQHLGSQCHRGDLEIRMNDFIQSERDSDVQRSHAEENV